MPAHCDELYYSVLCGVQSEQRTHTLRVMLRPESRGGNALEGHERNGSSEPMNPGCASVETESQTTISPCQSGTSSCAVRMNRRCNLARTRMDTVVRGCIFLSKSNVPGNPSAHVNIRDPPPLSESPGKGQSAPASESRSDPRHEIANAVTHAMSYLSMYE